MSFKCRTCGETHEDLPHIGADYPDPYFDIPEGERATRVKITSDLCSIDDEDFFIRGVVEIHVHGEEYPFGLGVWISEKKEDFETYARRG